MLRVRADLMRQVHSPLPDYCFLGQHYPLDVSTSRKVCDGCDHVKLRSQRIVKRYPVGILLGHPVLRHHIKRCPVCSREYSYEELNALVAAHGNYAYDIMVEVGLKRFQRHRQNKEIQKDIEESYGLALAESSINDLSNRFLDYLAAVHYGNAQAIWQIFSGNGGYVGHFDGTCEVGTDILFTAIDEISGIVLLTCRIPTENVNDIKQFLEKCRKLYGVPLATMRDLSQNIALARAEVFGDVLDLICQYHFLENVGNALFKKTYQDLTSLLRRLKIRPGLKSLRHALVRGSKNVPPIPEEKLNEFLNNPDKQRQFDHVILRKYLTYFIFRWLDDYCSELNGEYFPFDQPNLVFYHRCVEVYDLLNELLAAPSSLKGRERQTLASIVRVLEPVKSDGNLVDIAQQLEKKVDIFEELRNILRFNRADGQPILRQRPPDSSIKDVSQIEQRLNELHQQLQTRTTANDPVIVKSSKILIDYLDKYSDKLVGHLIALPARNQVILLDRTNNIPEHRFSKTKTGWRRKLGTKKLTRHLQAARHEEFLLANLDRQDYVNAVYGGSLDNMPLYFSKYYSDALEIRKLRNTKEEKNTMPISKKTLRQPGMLQGAVQALGGLFGCLS
jgi:hypothetical protein